MRRTRLGPHPNEGARKAWKRMETRELDQSSLRELILKETGKKIGSGYLVRVLYCDRRPGVEWASTFETVLGIPQLDWYREPEEKFQPPAALNGDAA